MKSYMRDSLFEGTCLLLAVVMIGFMTVAGTGQQLEIADKPAPLPVAEVWFSPKGGCTANAVAEINQSGKEILVQGYGFTSRTIADTLIEAHKRGVVVMLVLDTVNKTEKTSQAKRCHDAGIPVWIDHKHAIAHNKVMVIDGKAVLTGSFNWTDNAEEHNAENMVLLRIPELAKKYRDNWMVHRDHSDKYAP